MMTKKGWKEFKDSGMLWYVNRLLHVFGWAIVLEMNGEEVTNSYPARCKCRGFRRKYEEEGFKKVGNYLKNNSEELYNEAEYE